MNDKIKIRLREAIAKGIESELPTEFWFKNSNGSLVVIDKYQVAMRAAQKIVNGLDLKVDVSLTVEEKT